MESFFGGLSFKKRVKYLHKDFKVRKEYGPLAPKSWELIWVDPMKVNHQSPFEFDKGNGWKNTGDVISGDWDLESKEYFIKSAPKGRSCWNHFVDGIPWEDTGIYEYNEKKLKKSLLKGRKYYDGCQSRFDIIKRYNKIDDLYNETNELGRFKLRKELSPLNFRQYGNIVVHVGRNNKLIFGKTCFHRFAISKILNLHKIPVALGVVHPEALIHLEKLRLNT